MCAYLCNSFRKPGVGGGYSYIKIAEHVIEDSNDKTFFLEIYLKITRV